MKWKSAARVAGDAHHLVLGAAVLGDRAVAPSAALPAV